MLVRRLRLEPRGRNGHVRTLLLGCGVDEAFRVYDEFAKRVTAGTLTSGSLLFKAGRLALATMAGCSVLLERSLGVLLGLCSFPVNRS